MKLNFTKYNLIKYVLNTAIIAVFILFTLPAQVLAQNNTNMDSGYVVNKMTSDLFVHKSQILVTEKFDINFLEQRHGIIRYLPLFYEYHSEDGKVNQTSRLKINVTKVTDENGTSINYTKLPLRDSIFNQKDPILGLFYNALQIKIGDPNELISGNHIYEIDYTIENFPENANPFEYGLSGTGWSTTIKSYEGNIQFDEIPNNFSCNFGIAGQKGTNNCNVQKISDTKYQISATDISPAEGVEMIASGLTFKHDTSDFLLFIEENWYVVVPFIALLLLLVYWLKRKDPKGTGVITPQFGIPEKLKPAEAGTIYDDSADKVDISATIIDLAVQGYIKITNASDDDKKPYFILSLEKKPEESMKAYEVLLINALFSNSDKVVLEDLKDGSLATQYSVIQQSIYLWGIREGYFKRKPDKAQSSTYAVLFTAAAIIPGFFFNLLAIGPSIILGIILFIISLILFYTRDYKSEKGVLLKEKIEGLKLFIEYAKKDQLEMLSVPMSKQQIFETYLPYAMVFGLHKSWTEVFKDMNLTTPTWYEGNVSNNFFTNLYLISYINSFSNTMNSAFSVPVSQGGSGLVGGIAGSVGGGFSGGGGGSW